MRSALPITFALLAAGCARFDGPPDVTIVGESQGQLSDPTAPVVLAFSRPPKPSTVKVKIARYLVDDEGNLADEDDDDATSLGLLFAHDPTEGDSLGVSELAEDRSTLTITPNVVPPAGAPLVLLVEPGLSDDAGAVTVSRRRKVFTYASPLTCSEPAKVVRSGTYFFIAAITKPIATQVKLFGVVEIDPATGALKARFTKAKRNPDPNRCPMPCGTGEVCQLLPSPACVLPSVPAGSVDEYPDYVPDPDPPAGFGFSADGCTVDQDMTNASLTTGKVDVETAMPPVTLRNASLTASFTLGADDVLHGSGSLVCDAVLLGVIDSGKGQGDLTAVSIPDELVPKDLQGP